MLIHIQDGKMASFWRQEANFSALFDARFSHLVVNFRSTKHACFVLFKEQKNESQVVVIRSFVQITDHECQSHTVNYAK